MGCPSCQQIHGVPVIGYRTDSLPAFFTADSDWADAEICVTPPWR